MAANSGFAPNSRQRFRRAFRRRASRGAFYGSHQVSLQRRQVRIRLRPVYAYVPCSRCPLSTLNRAPSIVSSGTFVSTAPGPRARRSVGRTRRILVIPFSQRGRREKFPHAREVERVQLARGTPGPRLIRIDSSFVVRSSVLLRPSITVSTPTLSAPRSFSVALYLTFTCGFSGFRFFHLEYT
ncbi:hypothetical protein DFH08DRAFT_300064 [Mycena albidolilacea]|uniref:Uncharacterized protein n=1 Tax=Mycena albidolilacea TaxID=1033008 RepID=A0AAD7EKF0_9AGAR|nr:hypothetical protein DFH08DRAFT_300064 [Mycena albidolilacea]